MLPLAWIPFAAAHIPHDVVAAVAAPRDLDPSQPWFVVSNPWTLSLLYRSEDGGASWDALGGDPIQDILIAAATLDDHTVVLASEGRLWVSGDGGDTWSPHAAPGTVAALGAGASLTVATSEGLWSGAPDGLVEVASGPFVSVAPDGSAALDDSGAIWTRDGSSWTMRDGPEGAVSLVRDGDALYVGGTDGGVWRSSADGWTACGALPAPKAGVEDKVMVGHLAIDPVEGSLLATEGWRSPFRSTDQCATWADTGWTDGDPLYDVWGGAQSQAEAFSTLYAYGGERLVAGWAGLARSSDSGAHWTAAHMVAPDSCRAALIPRDWPSNPTILLGIYGAGPMSSDDGGATWNTDVHGLTDMAPQQFIGFLGDDADTVLSVQLHDLWVSHDAGHAWEQVPGAYDFVSSLGWFGDENLLLESGLSPLGASTGSIAASRDFMLTWHDVPDLNALVGVSEAIGYTDVDHGRLLCVAYRAPSGVACSVDKGATWTARYTGTAGAATAVVAWPSVAPNRLVWVDSNGLLVSEDDGQTWRSSPVPGGEPPLKLVLADDDTLLLATRSGRVVRSVDGGDIWTDLGVRTPAFPTLLSPFPGFAQDGAALILTHDGPYLLRDGQSDAPTLDRFSGYSRVDDASGFMECTGCVEVPRRNDAGLDSVVQVPAGGVASVGIRGTKIVVWGEPITGGEANVVVDGIERASIHGSGGSGIGQLAVVDGLAAGWHEVSVEGTQGGGLYLDAIDAFADGVTFPPGPTARCGCESARGGGAGLSIAALLWVRRRRSRGGHRQ